MEKECDYVEKVLGAIICGLCGDAAGNEHKCRVELVLLRPWYLAADCWAHQVSILESCLQTMLTINKVSLMLGDFVKRNPSIKILIDEVVDVVKWFNNHSYALGVLNEEQQIMNKKTLALIVPVVTRWTAYYLSMDRLLAIWKPLQITAIRHESSLLESVGQKPQAKAKAKQVIDRIRDDTWWRRLTRSVNTSVFNSLY